MANDGTDRLAHDGGADYEPSGQESIDHGGIVDIERFPGGRRVTAVRAELVMKYRGYQTLDESEKVAVVRWGYGSIVSHWVMVVSMFAAMLTGFMIWTGFYGPVEVGIWGGYQTAFSTHVWMGVLVAVVALVVFPFYHKVADGHSLLLSKAQLKEQVVILLAFVGLLGYIPGYKQARRAYDTDRDHWVGYHPAQTAFWYATWVLVILLVLTGFALWAEIATDPAWWISAFGFMEGWLPFEQMLQVHLVTTFLALAAIAVHAYVALLPSNRDIMGSMLHRTVDAWLVDDESRPEPATSAAEQPEVDDDG